VHIQIEQFESGWYGLALGLSTTDVDRLIAALGKLKRDQGHFHLRGDLSGSGPIADLELYLQTADVEENLRLDTSEPIFPLRDGD